FANDRRVASERAEPIAMAEDRNVRSTRGVIARQDRPAECRLNAKERKVVPGDILGHDTICLALDLRLDLPAKACEHVREYRITVAKLCVHRIRQLAAVAPGVPVEGSTAHH